MRLGVFGGTFDPPHLGHLSVARLAKAAVGLNEVLFVVAGSPWQKEGSVLAPGKDRLEMVRLLVRAEPSFLVSDIEIRRDGPSYTIDTLRQIAEERPGDELFLLLGGDTARGLPTWKDHEEIGQLAMLVVIERPGAEAGPLPIGSVTIASSINLSSTIARSQLRNGLAANDGVLDAEVARHITERGLYRMPLTHPA